MCLDSFVNVWVNVERALAVLTKGIPEKEGNAHQRQSLPGTWKLNSCSLEPAGGGWGGI